MHSATIHPPNTPTQVARLCAFSHMAGLCYHYPVSEDKPTAPAPISGPPWLAAFLHASPTQMIMLVGLLFLGGREGLEALSPDDIEARLREELARQESQDRTDATIAEINDQAAACLAAIDSLRDELQDHASDAETRANEQLAFTGELAQYLIRLAEATAKNPPESGPRLEEYIRKALLRDYRLDPDRREDR